MPDFRQYGKLTRATGLVMEAVGLKLPIGALCIVERQTEQGIIPVESEVVGFNGQTLFLMPLEHVDGILRGRAFMPCKATATPVNNCPWAASAGPRAGCAGSTAGWPPRAETGGGAVYPNAQSPAPRSDQNVLDVGVRAINGLLTVGRGQRMGLFAGSGVGKSVLLGMMARFTTADVIVVGLIGERGREVKDFIENILGEQGLARAVVVAAPADVSPILRMQGAVYATRIAEDFRERGLNVLLIMDS